MVQVRSEVVGGEIYNNHDRPPRRFGTGRQCAGPDCETRLSVYNESDYCSIHKVMVKPRTRRRTFV